MRANTTAHFRGCRELYRANRQTFLFSQIYFFLSEVFLII